MSTTVDYEAELTRLREHNRLLSDTITAMQHEINAHHVIAQTEYKELLELREIVRELAEREPRDQLCKCPMEEHGSGLRVKHNTSCLWLRARKYVETWDAET